HAAVPTFGPSAAAAQIEGSKTFAKDVLEAARVPTPARLAVARPPCVVKADGLAAGKGVFVCRTQAELDAGLAAAAAFAGPLVVEELLEGDEVSLLALAAGGDLGDIDLSEPERAAVTVVLAAGSYPERGDSGTPIDGVDDAEADGALVFHAGTALHDGRLVTNGGRVLNVTALGADIADA